MTGNPILDELDGLSPAAKRVLQGVGAQMPAVQAAQAPIHSLTPPASPVPQLGAPKEPQAMPKLLSGQPEPEPPAIGLPPTQKPQLNMTAPIPVAPRGTQAGDEAYRTHLLTSGSGISQIKNTPLRGLARVGDVVGHLASNMFAPGLMNLIPGTEEHHNLLLNQANRQVGQDVAERQKEAQANEAEARAQTLGTPVPVRMSPIQTNEGYGAFNPESGTVTPITDASGKTVQAPEKAGSLPNLQQNYASSVMDAIGRGADPNTDPKVKQIADSIRALQPAQKEGNYNVATELHKEHPDWSPEKIQGQTSRASFPRIIPITDASGNTHGVAYFQGAPGGGVSSTYIPLSDIKGIPSNLGNNPFVMPPKPTSAVLTQSQRALMIQPQVAVLTAQIDKVAPELGPLKGRWSDLMAGRVGANNPDIAKLQMQLKLFTTALMLAHGLRGESYEKGLEQYLRASQSPENLKARIAGADAYLQDYAQATGHGPTEEFPQENQPKVGDTKKFPNGKTGRWDGKGWVAE